ncbi:MAG TPA: efflux RND transporter periplasmic adaptor subunit [Casimicrobiaceae bacterium]|nr:efflux RND transporter periplasmic adaptor subunit [Casimicrobiaceae bacterium]
MPAIRRALVAFVLLAVIAGSVAIAFRYASGSRAAVNKAPPAVPVSIARVVMKDVPVRVHAIGNVEPLTTVAIKARVDGQIDAVRFKEGDEVHAGAVLFELDRRPFEAQLAQAKANLLKDKALLDHAREQEKRNKDLLAQKFISPDAYAQFATNVETAAATVAADDAAVRSVQLSLDYCTIRAPLTGYAGKVMIQQGNLVKANDTLSLVVINQVVPVNVSFSVPESILSDVRRYQADGELHVAAETPSSGNPVPGKLSFVDNTTDITTGTIKLKAEFPNVDKALWPGQFVNVVLTLTMQKNAIVAPTTAVQNGPNGQYVFIVAPNQTVALRDVKIARAEGDETVIASGLAPGDTVVTAGQLRLAPGTRVTIGAPGSA